MPVPPKSRMPLRYRAQYSDRVSVYRDKDFFARIAGDRPSWTVRLPFEKRIGYLTFDEAVHEAHRLARVRAERDHPHGEHPPIEAVRALLGVMA